MSFHDEENDEHQGGAPRQIHWTTLRHAGVMFPPEYVPHNVQVVYNNKPVKLTAPQEELATMYASMLKSDYITKPMFCKNFWDGWKDILGPKHTIQSLDKCDFTNIYTHIKQVQEDAKKVDKDEKKAQKKQKDETDAVYKVAYVDGNPEPVGNFRVEPPGLFRGRGEHPKMGMPKRRVYPCDVTINIGEGEPIPKNPYQGDLGKWKDIIHDPRVTWLAKWNDTVSPKDVKYVFLAPTSTVKVNSDKAKYEVARELGKQIDKVRSNYEADFQSTNIKRRQISTAIYLIDRLALRAGHEKGEDEADTVGTCTLKCENVTLSPTVLTSTITLDFLGKDSIRYENTVKVDPRVYKNIKDFKFKGSSNAKSPKKGSDMLFDTFTATGLNKELKAIMPDLSAKVFRTFNASFTLDKLLHEKEANGSEFASKTFTFKKAAYEHANKEVAVLCNHQRAIPKAHATQMQKLTDAVAKIKALKKETGALTDKQEDQLAKLQIQMRAKEALKQVALGTSKINYLDPRITYSWCKRNTVPIEKIFNKTLTTKFTWATESDADYRF